MIKRRTLIELTAGSMPLAFAGCATRKAVQGSLTITTCGQALMTHDVCADPYPGLEAVMAELRRGDVVFTGLETPIRTPQSGPPQRSGTFLHTAPPSVLQCLKKMGFGILALSNNHAFDLGTPGILATRQAVLEHGFTAAGSGADLAQASAPAYWPGPPPVALVSMAIGKIADGGAATGTRPGVNEVRFGGTRPHEEDVLRTLASIREASAQTPHVIAYLSNHEWGEDRAQTKPWARELAYRCVDAGASLCVAHGAPLLHGMEVYRGAAIFHSLGSLVFHSRTPLGHYPAEVWESAIVHVHYTDGILAGVEIVPLVLNESGDDPDRHLETRGRPTIAGEADAERILSRFESLSDRMGVSLTIRRGRAYL